MKKTVLLIIVILIAILIIGGLYITKYNNSDKVIKLTDEEKISINEQLLLLSGIASTDYEINLSKNAGNIIRTDEEKYNFIGLLKNEIQAEDIVVISNGEINESYVEISKFQSYAKKVYNQELNLNNLKDYILIQNNITYIKVPLEGMSADYTVKADYIVENREENTKSLYVNLIDLYNDNIKDGDVEKYSSADYLDYDETKVSYTLKITYAFNEATQENYIISIESV